MLILQRKVGESLLIGEDVEISVLSVEAGRVRLAIEAPKSAPSCAARRTPTGRPPGRGPRRWLCWICSRAAVRGTESRRNEYFSRRLHILESVAFPLVGRAGKNRTVYSYQEKDGFRQNDKIGGSFFHAIVFFADNEILLALRGKTYYNKSE